MTTSVTSRFRVLLVAAVLLALAGAGGVVVAEDPDHEHPDEVEDDDDLDAVQRWLGDRMGQIHVDCAEGMRVGNFDACEDLDEDYEKHLSRYVSVERETTDSDDRQSDRFDETRDKQAELATLLEEFWATHEDYREARAEGDEAEAREHARELLSLAERIEKLGGEVAVNFRVLDNRTAADLNASALAINETTEEVVTVRGDVEEESFVATELSMEADDTASFGSPATVSGRVVDEDGTPVSSATVAVADDRTTATVQTDEDGRFTAEYRPTTTEPGETNVSVRYVASPSSVYLGSEANATVDVEQTPTALTVSDATAEAGFGDDVTVAGEVEAADRGAPGVPVVVTLDGRRIGTDRTDEDGAFEVATSMPADVPTGDADVVVRASESDRALEPSRAESTMAVTETETTLNVSTTAADGQVRIEGVLLADADTDAAVGQRPVEVTVGDETRTTTTEPDGTYSVTVEPAAEDREVTVAYDEAGTNLGPSTASTTVPGETGAGGGDGSGGVIAALADLASGYPGLVIGAVGALLLAAGGGRALWQRRESGDAGTPADPIAGAAGPGAAGAGRDPSQSHLERARELLATSPNEAVKASYAAVRSGLGGEDPVRTHWEFYNDRTADLPADREAALRALTEFFERAAFAPQGLERSDAEAAVAEAERCLAASDGGTDGGTDGETAAGRPTD